VTGLLRALRDRIERAFATPVPEAPPRECPGGHPLDSGLFRVVREDGPVEVIRCICGTHSAWDRSPGYPVLVGFERNVRLTAAA
jgi:hypothetical protein